MIISSNIGLFVFILLREFGKKGDKGIEGKRSAENQKIT